MSKDKWTNMKQGWNDLAAAILKMAADDYVDALVNRNHDQILALERFFQSDWGQLLSLYQGDVIILNCRRIAKEKWMNQNNLDEKSEDQKNGK